MDAMLTGLVAAGVGFRDGCQCRRGHRRHSSFNASFSGLFKSFFDVLPPESLSDMPVLIGATGGTERHSLVLEHSLRPMFSYLQAIVSPTGVYAATEDFGAGQGTALGQRIAKHQPTSHVCRIAAPTSAGTCLPRRSPRWSNCSAGRRKNRSCWMTCRQRTFRRVLRFVCVVVRLGPGRGGTAGRRRSSTPHRPRPAAPTGSFR